MAYGNGSGLRYFISWFPAALTDGTSLHRALDLAQQSSENSRLLQSQPTRTAVVRVFLNSSGFRSLGCAQSKVVQIFVLNVWAINARVTVFTAQ
jgi:hypothetical protein